MRASGQLEGLLPGLHELRAASLATKEVATPPACSPRSHASPSPFHLMARPARGLWQAAARAAAERDAALARVAELEEERSMRKRERLRRFVSRLWKSS